MTMHPAASSPCTWKTDLEMSSPIMLAFIWTVLSAGVTSKRQLGTFDAVRGPSTQHCEERRDEAIQFWSAGKAGLRRFARNDTPTKIHPALAQGGFAERKGKFGRHVLAVTRAAL